MDTITTETGHSDISPVFFHLYAQQYHRCVKGFERREPFSPAPYSLVCKAIEMELKARHLVAKSPDVVKKEYGHDMKKAYDALDSSQRILDQNEYSHLVKASAIYDVPNKGFDYPSLYDAAGGHTKTFPDLDVLDRIAEKLIGAGDAYAALS